MARQVVRFELKANGTDLKLEAGRLISVLYYQSIRGCAQFWVEASDTDWKYFDALYGSDVELQMRIGIGTGRNTIWSPVQKLLVGDVKAAYHGSGVGGIRAAGCGAVWCGRDPGAAAP